MESRNFRVMEVELDAPSKLILFLSSTPYRFTYIHAKLNIHYQEHYVVESLSSLVNACSIAVVDADLSFDNMIIKKINNSPSP